MITPSYGMHPAYPVILTAEFLLGMAVNLIGFPSEATGSAKVAKTIFLGLHVLIAVGLLVGAVRAIRAARKLGDKLRHLTYMAAASIVITLPLSVAYSFSPKANLIGFQNRRRLIRQTSPVLGG